MSRQSTVALRLGEEGFGDERPQNAALGFTTFGIEELAQIDYHFKLILSGLAWPGNFWQKHRLVL